MKFINDDYINGAKYFIYGVFTYLEINADLYKILVILMCADTLFGVLKTLKMNYKEFSMKKLIWGIVSKFTLLLFPLLVALAAKALGKADLSIGVDIVIRLLIVSEFISSIGNMYTLKTGVIVKDIDMFSMVFKFVRRSFLKYFSRIISDKHKDIDNENN